MSRGDGETALPEAGRSPVHLEAKVFDLMTAWIERYRRQAEERYRRLDAVLAAMNDDAASITGVTDITTNNARDDEQPTKEKETA